MVAPLADNGTYFTSNAGFFWTYFLPPVQGLGGGFSCNVAAALRPGEAAGRSDLFLPPQKNH